MLGTVPSMLRPSPADPLVRQQRAAMWAGLRSTGRWRGEMHRTSPQRRCLHAAGDDFHGQRSRRQGAYHVLVISDITEQRQQRDRLERQAHFDELTRLPNRARLMQMLAEAMTRSRCRRLTC